MQKINLGQTCTLDVTGYLRPAVPGGASDSLTLINLYGVIHPGVNEVFITGVDGKQTISSPIYVAPNAIVQGTGNLTPMEVVAVWFEQNVATSTMIRNAGSNNVIIDLTQTDTASFIYANQQWKASAAPPS